MENLLKASVEALKQLRTEVHGKLEDRTIARLDEIVRNLEELEKSKDHQCKPEELLRLIGEAIKLLPTIGKAIEYLVNVAS